MKLVLIYIYLEDCMPFTMVFRLYIYVNILFLRLIINNFPIIRVLLLSFCPYSFGIFYLTATVEFLFLHALSYPLAKYGRNFIICIREWKSTLSFWLVFKWDTTMTTNFFSIKKSPPLHHTITRVSTIKYWKLENTLTTTQKGDRRWEEINVPQISDWCCLLPRKKHH